MHPDIQYQLYRMEHEERIREAQRHQQVREALAATRANQAPKRPVARLKNRLVAVLNAAFATPRA
ncbi:MAG: hypothetical protein ABSB99_11505 [Acidimicrobiales bacterium]|jgi:hypothetical protein